MSTTIDIIKCWTVGAILLTLQARYLSGYSRVPDLFPSDEFIVIFGVFFSFSHKLICRGITPMKQPIGQCATTCNQWYPPLASKPPFQGVRSQPCLTPETPNHPPFFGAQVRSQRSLGRTSGTCHGRHGRHCCLPGHWWWRGRFAGSSAVLVGLLVMQ